MIVKLDKCFVKDAERIKDQRLLNRVASCIRQIIDTENPEQIKSVKKLKGETCF